ncbi:uncharacterized protein LOC143902395 [Temnothorax americanus]|uniref:uncharacterized protein LOC143902395 n=1 Tax=Temnothorax americanus TaxID=1964332 RepID=UPI00406946D4
MKDNIDDPEYLLVQFNQVRNGKKIIELVPKTWTTINKRIWQCRYPPEECYPKINEWIKEKKQPDENWEMYPVKVLTSARNLEQGMRRLQRACTSFYNLESTDDGISKYSRRPQVLSEQAISNMLNENTSLTRQSIKSVKKNSMKGIPLKNDEITKLQDTQSYKLNSFQDSSKNYKSGSASSRNEQMQDSVYHKISRAGDREGGRKQRGYN